MFASGDFVRVVSARNKYISKNGKEKHLPIGTVDGHVKGSNKISVNFVIEDGAKQLARLYEEWELSPTEQKGEVFRPDADEEEKRGSKKRKRFRHKGYDLIPTNQ